MADPQPQPQPQPPVPAAPALLTMEQVNTQLQALRAEMATQFDGQLTTVKNQLAQAREQLEDVVNNGAGGAAAGARKGAHQRIASFTNETGDDDWIVFKRHFLTCATLNSYDGTQKKMALAAAMKGKAALATLDIDVSNVMMTFDQALALFEGRFLPAAASQLARTEFDAARQGQREKVLEYHGRLRAIHNRAYPDSRDETLLIRKFVMGLKSKELRMQAMRNYPDTYANALTIAQNEASVQQLVSVAELGAAVNQGEPMEIGSLEQKSNEATKPGRCHYCNKTGHWKRDCLMLKRAQRMGNQERGRGRGFQRGGRGGRPGMGRGGFRRARIIAALDEVLPEDDQEEGEAEPEETAAAEISPADF